MERTRTAHFCRQSYASIREILSAWILDANERQVRWPRHCGRCGASGRSSSESDDRCMIPVVSRVTRELRARHSNSILSFNFNLLPLTPCTLRRLAVGVTRQADADRTNGHNWTECEWTALCVSSPARLGAGSRTVLARLGSPCWVVQPLNGELGSTGVPKILQWRGFTGGGSRIF